MRSISLWIVVVVVAAAALPSQRRPAGSIVVGELGKRLEAAVVDAVPDYWGAVLVARGGKVVFARGYGPADRVGGRRQKEMSSKSVFDLGGAAAWLTSILAVRLQAEGRLQFGDTVAEHLAKWPADKAGITIEQLMLHTSGMPKKTAWADGAARGSRTAVAELAKARLRSQPGTSFSYSALNGILLGLVLEQAGGKRYDKLLESHVLKPFGMSGAGPTSARFDKKLLTWRRESGKDSAPANAVGYSWRQRGARAVLASVHDVHALLDGVFSGKLLDHQQRVVLLQAVEKGEFKLSDFEFQGQQMWRFEGYSTGYTTRWTVHPSSGSWVVLFTGKDRGPGGVEAALLLELANSLAPVAIDPSSPPPMPPIEVGVPTPLPTASSPQGVGEITLDELDRFVGTFRLPSGGTFRVERSDRGLRLQAAGLQASVRVREGRWPGQTSVLAQRSEDRGLALLGRLLEGDASVVDEAFADSAPAASASALLAGILAEHGALSRLEFVGTAPVDRAARSWFRVVCAQGSALVVVDWLDERRFARCRRASAEPPFGVDLTVTAPDWAVGRATGGWPLRLTIEGRGDARVMVFEDGSPGDDGLIDCELVPNSPR